LISDALSSTPPALIISNTAVVGAPAVLTVIGAAPVTNAGTYKIVSSFSPIGTNGASASLTATAAAQTWTSGAAPAFTGLSLAAHTHSVSSAAGAKVATGTDLTALTTVEFEATGL